MPEAEKSEGVTFRTKVVLLNVATASPIGEAKESDASGSASQSALVDLRPLKGAVLELPADHPLRLVVLMEPDKLSREEYAGRLPTWFNLLKTQAI